MDTNPEIRLWSEDDLARVDAGDRWLSTLLLNANTLSTAMVAHYPYARRRTFLFEFPQWDADTLEARVYATDPEMAQRFASHKFRPPYRMAGEILPERLVEVSS